MALTVLCLSFLIILLLGAPVSFAIGLSCLLTFLFEGMPLETGFQMMISGMNVFSFLAIPFFIFSGELMLHGGIADKIVDFARSLVGHWKGGLGLANVIACTLFGGVSGSPVADTSAMGGVMIPIMKREGYSAEYAVNVTTHASLTGALMPTSHNMIIYAFAAQTASGMIGTHVCWLDPGLLDHGVRALRGLLPSCKVWLPEARRWYVNGYSIPRLDGGFAQFCRRSTGPGCYWHNHDLYRERHYHGDRSGCNRCNLFPRIDYFHLSDDEQGKIAQGLVERFQNHWSGFIADRRIQYVGLANGLAGNP